MAELMVGAASQKGSSAGKPRLPPFQPKDIQTSIPITADRYLIPLDREHPLFLHRVVLLVDIASVLVHRPPAAPGRPPARSESFSLSWPGGFARQATTVSGIDKPGSSLAANDDPSDVAHVLQRERPERDAAPICGCEHDVAGVQPTGFAHSGEPVAGLLDQRQQPILERRVCLPREDDQGLRAQVAPARAPASRPTDGQEAERPRAARLQTGARSRSASRPHSRGRSRDPARWRRGRASARGSSGASPGRACSGRVRAARRGIAAAAGSEDAARSRCAAVTPLHRLAVSPRLRCRSRRGPCGPRRRERVPPRLRSPSGSSARRAARRAPARACGSPAKAEAARCEGARPHGRNAAPRRPRGSSAGAAARLRPGVERRGSAPEAAPAVSCSCVPNSGVLAQSSNRQGAVSWKALAATMRWQPWRSPIRVYAVAIPGGYGSSELVDSLHITNVPFRYLQHRLSIQTGL